MKKLLINLIIIILFLLIFSLIEISFLVFYFQLKEKKISEEISSEEQLKNLSSIILKNTKFKDYSVNGFSFKYPDWRKVEIDPLLIWPEEIAEKEKILLYLINSDGVKILATKGELNPQDLTKPFPLIFREIFEWQKEIMTEKGGLTDCQIIRESFFENGVIVESKVVIFGEAITSISKSIIFRKKDRGYIYSVGISGQEKIFEDYRLLANYLIDSIQYY